MINMEMNFNDVNALVFGDVVVDRYIDGSVSRISPEKPVPILKKRNENIVLGGAGNVIRNLASIGANVRVLSCVGEDYGGRIVLQMISECGADNSYLFQSSARVTSIKTRVVSGIQHFIRIDEEEILPLSDEITLAIENDIEKIFEGINVFIISDYSKGIVTKELTKKLIDYSVSKNIPVVVDPKGNAWDKYAGATICKPNYKEFLSMFREQPILSSSKEVCECARQLIREYNIRNILITLSEKGMILVSDSDYLPIEAINKNAIDVSGAGDTVISVLAACIAKKQRLYDCCVLSNEAASIVVSKPGTSAVTLLELKTIHDSNTKIVNIDLADSISQQLHLEGKTIVMTNGCFDLLHAGHLYSLETAKTFGDILIVALNSDESVKRLKGQGRPIIDQQNRAAMLQSLKVVDYVVIFNEDTPEEVIKRIKPDVLVKGIDYKGKEVAGKDYVESNGGHVKFVELKEGLSTSSIIEKIREMN